MKEKEYCIVCGKERSPKAIKYCSKKCMGLGKQGYKICPICGIKFKEAESSLKICCSSKCSKIRRGQLHKDGIYVDSIDKMRDGFADKVEEIGRNRLWTSKHWVIQSPTGRLYECDNLLNFIRENSSLFDGTPIQAFNGFQKIKRQENKNKPHSWKGWHLISCEENKNRYRKYKKQ